MVLPSLRRSILNFVKSFDVVGDCCCPPGVGVDQVALEVAFAAEFIVVFSVHLELNIHAAFKNFRDAGCYRKMVSQLQRPNELDVRRFDHPAKTTLHERLHRHYVVALHLIEPGRENVVEIPARVDVAVHVDVVRSNLHLRRES